MKASTATFLLKNDFPSIHKNVVKMFIINILFLLTTFVSYGQDLSVKGSVVALDTKEALQGVTILIEGTSKGTTTDQDGKFAIQGLKTGNKLIFSYIGYLSETYFVENDTAIEINLSPDLQSLNEVVVIGYGTEKKSLVTGAISKVTSNEISKTPSLRAEQALQGRTSGVTVAQTSGQPGSGFTVRVRGTGSNKGAEPIYIVDGMRMSGIENLNVADIESMEILKDAASAAIYGAQGANGVVLITTKSGEKGEAQINYRFYYGWQDVANKKFKVMDADEYLTYRWTGLLSENIDSASIINPVGSYHLPYPGTQKYNTNWLKEVINVAPMSEHNLSVSGGNEKFTYMASGSYFSQEGIIGGSKSNFTRYSARFNADYNVKKWLRLSNRLNFTQSMRKSLPENNIFGGYMNMAMNMDPLTPVTVNSLSELPSFVQLQNPSSLVKNSADKYYGISDYVNGEVYNPLALLEVQHSTYTTNRFLGDISADITLFDGLVFTSKVDYELAFGNNFSWYPKTYFNLENDNIQNGVNKSTEKWLNWQIGNMLSYSKQINEHKISAIVGTESRDEKYNGLWINGSGLIREDENSALLNLTPDSLLQASDAITEKKWISYFGRFSYNYAEKYILSLVMRADGSSLFGPKNRFGYFPSASLGWVVSKENFWSVAPINFFKVRASWGQNGSTSNLEPFQWAAFITEIYQYPSSDGQLLRAAEPSVLSNPNLKWETSEQLDLGFDMGLWNNSLTLNIDYYRKTTHDLLTKATYPYVYGNYNSYINAGDVLNTGIEIELGHKKTFGNFSYGIDCNVAYNYNEVLNTGKESVQEGVTLHQEDGPITKFQKNYPVWYYSAYVTDGIFQTDEEASSYVNVAGVKYQSKAVAGDVKFKDINKDGVISSKDRVMVGDPNPNWIVGTNISVSYKKFDLSIFWQGAFGHQIVNALNRSDRVGYNKPEYYYTDAWTGEGSTNNWFRMTDTDPNGNFRNSDLFVEDADYLRLKNIQLGYNFGNINFSKDFGIKNARVYVSAQNLVTFTSYKGLDPEIGAVSSPSSVGIDYGFYPASTIYQVGVNVTF